MNNQTARFGYFHWWSWRVYQDIICGLSRSKLLRELLIIHTLLAGAIQVHTLKKLNKKLSVFNGGAGGYCTRVRKFTSYPSTGLYRLGLIRQLHLKTIKIT